MLAALSLTACGTDASNLAVRLDRDGHPVTLQVIDDAGLVTAVRAGADGAPDSAADLPAVWHPRGKLTELGVAWLSGTCSQHPVLRLSGNALQLTIDEGPGASPCTLMGINNLVTLSLNSVVDASAITVQLASP